MLGAQASRLHNLVKSSLLKLRLSGSSMDDDPNAKSQIVLPCIWEHYRLSGGNSRELLIATTNDVPIDLTQSRVDAICNLHIHTTAKAEGQACFID